MAEKVGHAENRDRCCWEGLGRRRCAAGSSILLSCAAPHQFPAHSSHSPPFLYPRTVAASVLGVLFVFVLATVLMNLVRGGLAAKAGWKAAGYEQAGGCGDAAARRAHFCHVPPNPPAHPQLAALPCATLPCPQLISIMTNTLDKVGC